MIEIFVKTRFTAFHNWPDAPEEVGFLRNIHRHEFHVEVRWNVSHSDRDREFFIMKRKLQTHLTKYYFGKNLGERSCEMIAYEIMEEFEANTVIVSEDGENGSIWRRE